MESSRNNPSIDLWSFARTLLQQVIDAASGLPKRPLHVCVGYSGGLDSTVALHALHSAGVGNHPSVQLSAVHVHHGLSPNADKWAEHCDRFCAQLGVPLLIKRVQVEQDRGLGLEAAARQARYAAYSELEVDLIVLGHHQDDQAETLLLNLLRGTSICGAAAIPARRGLFVRPLLGIPKAQVRAYAEAAMLAWIEDESNDCLRFTRNYLRKEILPRLQTRFPDVQSKLANAAGSFAEAQTLLDELAVLDGAATSPLPLSSLRKLTRTRAANAFAYHLRMNGVRIGSRAWFSDALSQLLDAAKDRQVELRVDGLRIYRHRDQLILEKPREKELQPKRWDTAFLDVPWGGGYIRAKPTLGKGIAKAVLKSELEFRIRQGGERFEVLPGLRRALKDLMREAGIPHWQRHGLPLLFCGGELVWVPFVGIAEKYRCGAEEDGISLEFIEASW